MIEIRIGDKTQHSARARVMYRVAGQTIVCNEALWPLAPYRLKQVASGLRVNDNVEHVDFRRPRLRRTTGWLGERLRKVKTVDHQAGTEVYIEGVGRLFISATGELIELGAWTDEAHRELLIEAAVGPALCLALAPRDIFCLHASAVVGHGRATLFCGPSTAGKSTLAHRLPGHPGFDLRLTDDIAAVAVDDGAHCLGHFPQLKLGADEHCINEQSQAVPIDRIVLLRGVASDSEFAARQIDPASAAIALARHTVASRLFSTVLMKHHLKICSMLVSRTTVLEIDYPHTAYGVDLVAAELGDAAHDLLSIPGGQFE